MHVQIGSTYLMPYTVQITSRVSIKKSYCIHQGSVLKRMIVAGVTIKMLMFNL